MKNGTSLTDWEGNLDTCSLILNLIVPLILSISTLFAIIYTYTDKKNKQSEIEVNENINS